MRKNLLLFALIAILIVACNNEDDTGSVVNLSHRNLLIPAEIMGMVHAGYYHESNRVPDNKEREFALLDEMGVIWMLRDFSWSTIQPSKDIWNFDTFDRYIEYAEQYNKKILAILDYDVAWIHENCNHMVGNPPRRRVVAGGDEVAAFVEYTRRTVERYKGKVGAWSIWNEPNLFPRFWTGTPEEFFILTKATAAAIREVDPNAIILGGGTNTVADDEIWTRGLFESGAMAQVDYFSYHPYMPDATTTGRAFARFRDYLTKYNFENRIWITEVGYPFDMGPGGYDTKVPAIEMPEMVIKTLVLLAAEGAQIILWYELFDNGANADVNDSENWFGLVERDTLKKKGGADAYQLFAHNVPGKTLRGTLSGSSDLPDYINGYYFEGSDGKHTMVIWTDRQSRTQQLSVTLPGVNRRVWDVATGSSTAIDETSTWTLKARDGVNKSFQFFTWENNDLTKMPHIIPR